MKKPRGTYKHSGPWLASVIKERGISHEALAHDLRLRYQHISGWACGVAKVPPKHIKAICKSIATDPLEIKALEIELAEKIILDERERVMKFIQD